MINIDEMIQRINNKHVYIQTHNFPDPDAIASAYGLQYLLRKKGQKSTIIYKGKVNHGSSYNMIKKLDIDIVEYSDDFKMSEETDIFLVDAQKGNANIIATPGSEVVCIDHHPSFGKVEYIFSDIRSEVGACASIIAEYIFSNSVEMDKIVATALLYGIKIDTANMTRNVSQLDLDMFYKLHEYADLNLLSQIDNSVLRQEDLKAYSEAIKTAAVKNKTCYASTGYNCAESIIASISDFILMLDNVDNAIVYSIKEDGIKISVRCTKGLNAGKITNKALLGIGSGGGHENMAGGFVPYNKRIKNAAADSKYTDELIKEIQKRFAIAMKK